jgi:hypothetical protein
MKSLKRAALAVLVVGVVLVVFLCCSFVLFEGAPSYLVFPSTRTIAKRYLEVVIAGDVKQVGRLAGSDGECQVLMQELAQADNSVRVLHFFAPRVAGGKYALDDRLQVPWQTLRLWTSTLMHQVRSS